MRLLAPRITQDRKAVGGFLEVGFAMVAITSGIALLLMTTIVLQGSVEEDEREALEDFAQDLTVSILADKDILQDEGVLRYSSLDLLGDLPLPQSDSVRGYQIRLVLMDREIGSQVILCHGSVPEKVLLLVSKQTPICLAFSINEVNPAILEVLVW